MRELRIDFQNSSTVLVLALVYSFFITLNDKLVFYANAGERCSDHNYGPFNSHTTRSQLATTANKKWQQEMYAEYQLTSTEFAAKKTNDFKNKLEDMKGPPVLLKDVSLHDVKLDPNSLHGRKQQANLEYLLMLTVDGLAFAFRNNSGLPLRGKPYGGWEAPDFPLRGHFVGHYLSASAKMWASTHNETLKQRMTALVSALAECQDKMGTGYLSAFPTEDFDRVEALATVWAPYYTVHKIMAGLLDQYIFAQNDQALKMLTRMVEYFYNRVKNVIKTYGMERLYTMLNEEFGGMNDLLYQLYRITHDAKHLEMAHFFDKPCFLGLLAMKADNIAGLHSNTHIPIVVGAQSRYELLGDELYKEIGTYFMEIINTTHSFATGGTSVNEHWADPMRLAGNLTIETEESCATYNMLKVSRNMFRWTKDVKYADYYERALTNGVIGILRGTEPGVMIYMLPLAHGVSKGKSIHGWGTPFDSFWCCYGTGIESFSKLGDSIYFEEEGQVPGLYVHQYISSTLNWQSAGIVIKQTAKDVVSWDQRLQVTIAVTPTKGAKKSTLNLRIPSWSYSNGAKASLNGQPLPLPNPGTFLPVTKQWNAGDTIALEIPFGLRTETIQDDRPEYASLKAILYGPYLLAGLSDGDFNIKIGAVKSLSDWITPIPPTYNSQLITLTQGVGSSSMTYLSTKNKSFLVMEPQVQAYNSSFMHATFRLILKDSVNTQNNKIASLNSAIGKLVTLEPIDLPGMVIAHQEKDAGISLVNQGSNSKNGDNFVFRLVNGLNAKNGTVSLESAARPGCFVHNAGQNVMLSCKGATSNGAAFNDNASFSFSKGLKQYHPISFLAKGMDRSYVLEPIFSFENEFYSVYFSITS